MNLYAADTVAHDKPFPFLIYLDGFTEDGKEALRFLIWLVPRGSYRATGQARFFGCGRVAAFQYSAMICGVTTKASPLAMSAETLRTAIS